MTIAKMLGIAVLAGVVITGYVYFEKSLWRECRQTNSVLYCLRLLGG